MAERNNVYMELNPTDMKQAWGMRPKSAGAPAGMRRPMNPTSPEDFNLDSLSLVHSMNDGISLEDTSSSTSVSSLQETDEDITTPVLRTPVGIAPPPPLRNIPHQTADETTSNLYTQQTPQNVPHDFFSPMAHQTTPSQQTRGPRLPSSQYSLHTQQVQSTPRQAFSAVERQAPLEQTQRPFTPAGKNRSSLQQTLLQQAYLDLPMQRRSTTTAVPTTMSAMASQPVGLGRKSFPSTPPGILPLGASPLGKIPLPILQQGAESFPLRNQNLIADTLPSKGVTFMDSAPASASTPIDDTEYRPASTGMTSKYRPASTPINDTGRYQQASIDDTDMTARYHEVGNREMAMSNLPDRVIVTSNSTVNSGFSTPDSMHALYTSMNDANVTAKYCVTSQSDSQSSKGGSQDQPSSNSNMAVSSSSGATDGNPLLQILKDSLKADSLSDSEESQSTSESSENECRDTFDTDIHIRNLPTVTRGTGTLGSRSGQSHLAPLSADAGSRVPNLLPHIARGLGSLPSLSPGRPTSSPPSYQEVDISHVQRPQTSRPTVNNTTTPPNYYSGNSRPSGISNEENAHNLSTNPIHLSSMEGVGSMQMKILVEQCGVDLRDAGGRTPLMYAVLGNQPRMCEVLLKLKADVNAIDLAGMSSLLWAAYQSKPEVVRVLLKNNADALQIDTNGRTAFHWAMKTPNINCLKWLCKFANIPEVINQPDKDNLTALHWGVMGEQIAHIKMLLSQTTADVSVQDNEGRTPLNYAVLNFSPSSIRALLDHNDGAISLIDSKGRTALHYACAEGSVDCVRTLLSYRRCDIQFTDNNGTTPLHWAAVADQPGLVQLLLRRGADREQRDNNGCSPLDYAEQRGNTDCVRILCSYGLQRVGSATSLASHVSVNFTPGPPSMLDDHGHVIFKRFQRQTSFSNRPQADSQAQSPSAGEQQESPQIRRSGSGSRRGTEGRAGQEGSLLGSPRGIGGGSSLEQRSLEQGKGSSRGDVQGQRMDHSRGGYRNTTEEAVHSERGRWRALLCCCSKRTSTVTPL